MASDHLPEDTGILPDFLARHTIDSSLLPSPLNGANRRDEGERREIERREREASQMTERGQREREAREREMRARTGRQERETREREARESREKERTERNGEEQRVRRLQGERAPIQESINWQCQHYQRLCSVSFPCCGVFYPCHRCHNESDACEIDDMKANQATYIKCASCGHEHEIKWPIEL
ncbi:uncharacterized protein LOC141884822 [Acropora palmata]|uniref:uncharacterized protein LOC141884822 n=1 Tax=Acropora palmata TaxID=6131 RepID=UPI003DA0DCA7